METNHFKIVYQIFCFLYRGFACIFTWEAFKSLKTKESPSLILVISTKADVSSFQSVLNKDLQQIYKKFIKIK